MYACSRPHRLRLVAYARLRSTPRFTAAKSIASHSNDRSVGHRRGLARSTERPRTPLKRLGSASRWVGVQAPAVSLVEDRTPLFIFPSSLGPQVAGREPPMSRPRWSDARDRDRRIDFGLAPPPAEPAWPGALGFRSTGVRPRVGGDFTGQRTHQICRRRRRQAVIEIEAAVAPRGLWPHEESSSFESAHTRTPRPRLKTPELCCHRGNHAPLPPTQAVGGCSAVV